jgi:hypothetical protein
MRQPSAGLEKIAETPFNFQFALLSIGDLEIHSR